MEIRNFTDFTQMFCFRGRCLHRGAIWKTKETWARSLLLNCKSFPLFSIFLNIFLRVSIICSWFCRIIDRQSLPGSHVSGSRGSPACAQNRSWSAKPTDFQQHKVGFRNIQKKCQLNSFIPSPPASPDNPLLNISAQEYLTLQRYFS